MFIYKRIAYLFILGGFVAQNKQIGNSGPVLQEDVAVQRLYGLPLHR